MSKHGAKLSIPVIPNGDLNDPGVDFTTGKFEYGETTDYGSEVEIDPIPAGRDEVQVETVLADLKPETEYHWRIVVNNNEGHAESDDVVFTTLKDENMAPVVGIGVTSDIS